MAGWGCAMNRHTHTIPGVKRYTRRVERETRNAAAEARERVVLANIAAQIFRFDLSDPTVHPAVENVLRGGVSSLRAISSEIVGGAPASTTDTCFWLGAEAIALGAVGVQVVRLVRDERRAK